MPNPLTPQQAIIRAEEMCARAEHCSGEIRLKLRQWGIATAEADAIVARLTATRFIDDRRFARVFARDKVLFNRWGRLKIRAALIAKRVAADIIDEALADIDAQAYSEALRATIDAKRRLTPDADTREGRLRLLRHAAARGFEPQLIIAAINADPCDS
ncbi:MAG: regulatory protein RecX [Muribaculaceae bacterium]